ncbi:MAG: ATP phosphoribosyltransferase [Ichthyobacteriaceae bacterium]|nr:ATP phosphoribosyltransferase [Ichthyobacteriaceae bacterium]
MSILRIAVQKSGRLNEDSLKILKDCGISINNGKGQLKAQSSNFPLEILYLRSSDIPQYVQDGVADIAIVGENVLVDKRSDLNIVEKLGFSKCRVSLAVPKEVNYTGAEWFEGKRLATSYVNTAQDFFDAKGIKVDYHKISGSVEIAPNIGLADGICDIVESGSTLFKNGLKEVEEIFKSEAVLVSNKKLSAEKQAILDKLVFRIKAVLKGKKSKYVLLNIPKNKVEEISNLLPGMKSPTVTPLAKEGWCSIQTVIEETKFWEVIDELKNAGAEGILIMPIEKIVL